MEPVVDHPRQFARPVERRAEHLVFVEIRVTQHVGAIEQTVEPSVVLELAERVHLFDDLIMFQSAVVRFVEERFGWRTHANFLDSLATKAT